VLSIVGEIFWKSRVLSVLPTLEECKWKYLANVSIESEIVQVMHQTVREFLLRPNESAPQSKLDISYINAHATISIISLRYLMLCAANTSLKKNSPTVDSWTSEHFIAYAQYLKDRPFINYVLSHFEHHIRCCPNVVYHISELSKMLTNGNPMCYLLENLVANLLNKPLLDHKLRNAADGFRSEILWTAARMGFYGVAEALLIIGAQVNTRLRGETPLVASAKEGHEAVVKLLLDRDAKIEARDSLSGSTALHLAAENGHENLVQLLIDRSANVNALTSHSGFTALHLAAEGGHLAITKLLLNSGADIGVQTSHSGFTALHLAAEGGHLAVAQLLLAGGADIQVQTSHSGFTALHLAAEGGYWAIAQLLLDCGANIQEQTSRSGLTALHLAAENGNQATAQLLINHGANIQIKTPCFGSTALHLAAENGHKNIVQLLFKHTVDKEAKDNSGGTALHHAAEKGHEGVVQILLDHHVDKDAKSIYGRQALHFAAANGHEAVAQRLINCGAVITTHDNDGWTPLRLALEEKYEALQQLLRESTQEKEAHQEGYSCQFSPLEGSAICFCCNHNSEKPDAAQPGFVNQHTCPECIHWGCHECADEGYGKTSAFLPENS
jgi:ankyrin repeat protein